MTRCWQPKILMLERRSIIWSAKGLLHVIITWFILETTLVLLDYLSMFKRRTGIDRAVSDNKLITCSEGENTD